MDHQPGLGDVVLGCVAVVVASLVLTYCIRQAWSGNRVYWICAVGALGVILGVIGQQAYPSDDAVHQFGLAAASQRAPGLWNSGVTLPIVGIRVTPLAFGGGLLTVAGLAALLVSEPADARRNRHEPVR